MLHALKSDHIYDRMVELRRAFHRRPELAFKEEQTAKAIMEELDRCLRSLPSYAMKEPNRSVETQR